MAIGKVYHELELEVPATLAWQLYGTLDIARLVAQTIPDLIQKVQVIQGDGGVGTILHLTFASGVGGPTVQIEKFTKIDDEKMVKEVEVIEGGLLEFGLSLYRVRFEVIPTGTASTSPSNDDDNTKNGSCIIRSTVEYDVKQEEEGYAAKASSLVSIDPFVNIAQIAKTHLIQKHQQRLHLPAATSSYSYPGIPN